MLHEVPRFPLHLRAAARGGGGGGVNQAVLHAPPGDRSFGHYGITVLQPVVLYNIDMEVSDGQH